MALSRLSKVFLHVDICHILIRGLSWYLSLLSFLHFNKINFIYLFFWIFSSLFLVMAERCRDIST